MNTTDYINNYKKEKSDELFKYLILPDGDILIKSHKYNGMKVSDIMIIDPTFIYWNINEKNSDSVLRSAIKNLINK